VKGRTETVVSVVRPPPEPRSREGGGAAGAAAHGSLHAGSTKDHDRLLTTGSLQAALHKLAALDPETIQPVLDRVGVPPLRLRPSGFAGLAAIIVAQQVSTASATAIFGRLQAAVRPFSAEALLAVGDEGLRGCGLSGSKLRTLRGLAERIVAADLSLDEVGSLAEMDARAALMRIPGVGPWTADVYRLFCLGHADAWPAGDLALQKAVRAALTLTQRPSVPELERIGSRWRPVRGAAAYLFWGYYRLLSPARRTIEGAVPAT
jgi:DNA-3-methyladenine glycosylase II